MLNFETAIELFLKALQYEKDHANIIVKNLTKTVIKLINGDQIGESEDSKNNFKIILNDSF